MELTLEELRSRLKEGDVLELRSDGGTFEVWAEVYANPSCVYYEGEPYPMSEFDQVTEKILKAVDTGEYRARWVED